MFPDLKRVGVAWNPAEANSRAFVEKARVRSAKDGEFELLEANVENSNSVLEAEDSLVARGAEALWIGGDVTVSVAADSVVSVGRRAHIPVFSITPGKPDRGTLFDYGADFYEIGKQTGELASRILRGADPTQIPVTNEIPIHFVVNTTAVKDLKQQWRIPDDILRRANVVVDEAGIHKRTVAGQPKEQAASSRVKEMQITKRFRGETVELKIEGRVDGYWADHLAEAVDQEIRQGSHHIQVDLSQVTFLSSAGIGTLVRLYKELKSVQGSFVSLELFAQRPESTRAVEDWRKFSSPRPGGIRADE